MIRQSVVPILACLMAAAPAARAQRVDRAEHHQFAIDNFKTESGVVLPKAIVVYGTYGRLNAARDNAILLPSHYMANHHGYEWLIGAGTARSTPRSDVPRRAPSCSATDARRRRATRRSRFTARASR